MVIKEYFPDIDLVVMCLTALMNTIAAALILYIRRDIKAVKEATNGIVEDRVKAETVAAELKGIQTGVLQEKAAEKDRLVLREHVAKPVVVVPVPAVVPTPAVAPPSEEVKP